MFEDIDTVQYSRWRGGGGTSLFLKIKNNAHRALARKNVVYIM
jgi:hypothetical protein